MNFYLVTAGGSSGDSALTQDQVTGNASSVTLGSTIGLGVGAVTLNSNWNAGVKVPAILVTPSQMNFGYNNQDVLAHELLHAYLNVDDPTLYNDFAKYGLVNPGDGSTSSITNWIMTGCKSTPKQ